MKHSRTFDVVSTLLWYCGPMEPQWLDSREERAWRGFHRMRAELTAHLARQLSQECGLSEAEYAILVVVSEAPGRRIRWRELCRALGWERSRLSHQISRMETRGTVERATCVDDARGFDVVLTRPGRRAVESAAPIHLETVRHCFIDLLTAEQLDTLGTVAEIVTKHLETQHAEDCSPRLRSQ